MTSVPNVFDLIRVIQLLLLNILYLGTIGPLALQPSPLIAEQTWKLSGAQSAEELLASNAQSIHLIKTFSVNNTDCYAPNEIGITQCNDLITVLMMLNILIHRGTILYIIKYSTRQFL